MNKMYDIIFYSLLNDIQFFPCCFLVVHSEEDGLIQFKEIQEVQNLLSAREVMKGQKNINRHPLSISLSHAHRLFCEILYLKHILPFDCIS